MPMHELQQVSCLSACLFRMADDPPLEPVKS